MSRRASHMNGRDRLRRAIILFRAQDGLCAHCAEPMEDPEASRARKSGPSPGGEVLPDDPTLDHVVPRSKRGRNALCNLLLAHLRCNQARADGPMGDVAVATHAAVLSWLEAQYGPAAVRRAA